MKQFSEFIEQGIARKELEKRSNEKVVTSESYLDAPEKEKRKRIIKG